MLRDASQQEMQCTALGKCMIIQSVVLVACVFVCVVLSNERVFWDFFFGMDCVYIKVRPGQG